MAERWQNPYTPGAATLPPVLTGRDDILARFAGYLRAREEGYGAEYLVLSGYRGMGKTVLLYAFRDLARERGWLAQRVEATDEAPFLVSLASEVADLLEGLDAQAGVLRRARQAVEELSVALGVGPAKVEVKAKRRAGASAPPVDVPVARLVAALGTAAKERKVGAALLLDEVQAVDPPALRAIARAFQAAEGDRLPVILSAGGLPNAPDRLREAVSYAERYRYVTLDRLGPAAVRAALEEPAARLGVRFSGGALDHLVAASEGYPYLVQLLGRNAWEAAGGTALITLEHARTAEGGARADLTNSLLRSRWLRASPKEREYLAAMASLGGGPVPSGSVARALGQTAQQLSSVRQSLIDKGVVMPSGTRAVDFTIPGFAAFVIEEAGLDVPSSTDMSGQQRKGLPPATLAEQAQPRGLTAGAQPTREGDPAPNPRTRRRSADPQPPESRDRRQSR